MFLFPMSVDQIKSNGLDRLGGEGSTVAPVTNRHWGSQLPSGSDSREDKG